MKSSDEMLLQAVKRWQDQNRQRLERQKYGRGIRQDNALEYLLKPLEREVKKNIRHPLGEWQEVWVKTVGPEIAASARVQNNKAGTLIIEVDNAPLRTELEAYYSGELLEALKEARPGQLLRGLKFVLGTGG